MELCCQWCVGALKKGRKKNNREEFVNPPVADFKLATCPCSRSSENWEEMATVGSPGW
jgi:hypothetical protein